MKNIKLSRNQRNLDGIGKTVVLNTMKKIEFCKNKMHRLKLCLNL